MLVASLVTSPPAAAHGAGSSPIRFGAAQPRVQGITQQQAVQRLEESIGRSLAVVRVYLLWDSPFPNPYTQWLKDTGHSVFLSVRARRTNGTAVSWRAIADAQPGDPLHREMVSWADRIKAYGTRMFLAFNHEPDTTESHASGTAADYVAAARAWVSTMRAHGVTNAEHSWTIAVRNLSVPPSDVRYAPDYYPGDPWVDNIAVDAYNMYCLRTDGRFHRPWRSLEELLAPFMAFARDHPGPALVVAEFGSPEDPDRPGRKAQWISEARQLFQRAAYARIKSVSYWNRHSINFVNCDFRVTSSESALEAFRQMANDPYYAAGSL